MRSGLKDVNATCAALLVILFFSPVAAAFLSILPLEDGLTVGLFIVCAMPTTLSSGVVMTARSGGNMAHALFVTIISNAASLFSIPAVLSILFSFLFENTQFEIETVPIMIKLGALVIFPLLSGLSIKRIFFQINSRTKLILQTANQTLVVFIVFMAVSGAKSIILGNLDALCAIAAVAAAFHMMLLLSSLVCVKAFRIPEGRRESVIFMGSQKTLPLSVILQMTYFSQYGNALLFCVIHHLVHLMIDGYISARMKTTEP